MNSCTLCPRKCGVPRSSGRMGFCGESDGITISRAALHMWEEPPISGSRGSGTIFFSGCNLRCVFCQNKLISRGGGNRKTVTSDELCEIMLELKDTGAHNINLVTPTHFADKIALSLENIKDKLSIPVVYNTSGYESVETLKKLSGLVDVYLPDFKYASNDLSKKYSQAPDYPEVASEALSEMFSQVGECVFNDNGIIQKGVIVRHLVLPSHRKDSMAVLDLISALLPKDKIKLSLMSQYTPDFALDTEFKNLHRRLTTFEYESVLRYAEELGFDGYFQNISSATAEFTPDFTERNQ